MMRNQAGGLPGAALVAALLLPGCAGEPEDRNPDGLPHIVLISVDTLNPERLGPWNPDAPALPTLDSLAERSTRFLRAYSPTGWTLPSHASLLTGTYPDRHGATDPRRRIAAEVPMLAEVLRHAGYETAGFTDEGYTDAEFGFARGFDIYNAASDGSAVKPQKLPRGGKSNRMRGQTLFDRAVAYVERRRGNAPLFLFLQTYSVHDYFQSHPWAMEIAGVDGPRRDYRACIQGEESCPDDDWRTMEDLYRAEVQHLDAGVGRLLDALEAAGLADSAWVAFVSDHGEGFRPDLGRIHHGGRLHRDQVHVPFLLAGPGAAPLDVARPVSLVDVVPTLLELADVPVPGGLDGTSLAAVVRGSGPVPDPAPVRAMEHYYRWEDGRRLVADEPRALPWSAATIDGAEWFILGDDGDLLYDVEADPEQLENLAAGPRARALRERLLGLLRPVPAMSEAAVDSALQEQLRSLGYVE